MGYYGMPSTRVVEASAEYAEAPFIAHAGGLQEYFL